MQAVSDTYEKYRNIFNSVFDFTLSVFTFKTEHKGKKST